MKIQTWILFRAPAPQDWFWVFLRLKTSKRTFITNREMFDNISAELGRCYRAASQVKYKNKTPELQVFERNKRSRSVHYLHLNFNQPSDNALRWVFLPNSNQAIWPWPEFTLWFGFSLLVTTGKTKVAYFDPLRVEWSFGGCVSSIPMQWTDQTCSRVEFFFCTSLWDALSVNCYSTFLILLSSFWPEKYFRELR